MDSTNDNYNDYATGKSDTGYRNHYPRLNDSSALGDEHSCEELNFENRQRDTQNLTMYNGRSTPGEPADISLMIIKENERREAESEAG